MRLRRKQVLSERHTEFSPILFDVLFGLLIFLGIASFFSLNGSQEFAFLALSLAIVVHWWLKDKSADDTYGHEVGNSALDLLFGLLEIVLLQCALLSAGQGQFVQAAFYFTLPLLTESVWALLWRFLGNWRRTTRERVRFMEQQLETTVFLNLGAAASLATLIVNADAFSRGGFLWVFAALSIVYAGLCSFWELVDVQLL